MRKMTLFSTFLLLMISAVSYATVNTFVSGSTGSDGAFSPSSNTVVTLPASGILNYTTINIPAGVTVTFTPNALNTPVYLLATGNVTIAGTINVNGANATTTAPGAGGPGGFSGGYSYNPYTVTGGNGLGPGGGNGSGPTTTPTSGIHGSYAGIATGSNSSFVYGNINILPMIGGSGGGGGYYSGAPTSNHGGGGGGAILIASSGTITHNGSILAKGGVSTNSGGGAGSAGAIKLMATTVTGSGTMDASSAVGGYGRTRVESYNLSLFGTANPGFTYGIPGSVFGSAPPSIAITSIGGINTPASPAGSYTTADITLPNTTTNPVPVGISATNIPTGTSFIVKVIPQGWKNTTLASDLPPVTTTLSGTDASSSGTVNITIPTTCTTVGLVCTSVIVVQATFTVTAFNYNGDEINAVRVASSTNGTSELFYITKTGKEVKVG
jgi:hypothetical protein